MLFQIETTENDAGRYYILTGEKAAMSLSVMRSGRVYVCSHNAAASLNRNLGGKNFHGPNALSKALEGYKSSTSKAMIQAVIDAENLAQRLQ